MTTINTYGLESFGIDATDELNTEIIKLINLHFKDEETGYVVFTDILEELHQKCEAIQDGRSKAFRMFTSYSSNTEAKNSLTKDIIDLFTANNWHYQITLDKENSLLLPIKNEA